MMQSPMFPVMLSERFECQRLKSWMRPQTSSLHLLLTLLPPSSAACLQRLLFQATRQRWVILAAPSNPQNKIHKCDSLRRMDPCAPWNT